MTPSEWENKLKFSPYVTDAVVIGDKRPFLNCLVMIDQDNLMVANQAMGAAARHPVQRLPQPVPRPRSSGPDRRRG